jgi:TolA-binding protein
LKKQKKLVANRDAQIVKLKANPFQGSKQDESFWLKELRDQINEKNKEINELNQINENLLKLSNFKSSFRSGDYDLTQ